MNPVDHGKKKRAKWIQNDMSKAVSGVRDGRLSVSAESKHHDVYPDELYAVISYLK